MLLKAGMAMVLFSVVLATVVAVVVSHSSLGEEQSASQVASVEPVVSEATAAHKEQAFNPGEKLHIEKPGKKKKKIRKKEKAPPPPLAPAPEPPQILPVAPANWPQPSVAEVTATQAPRYYT